MQIVLSYWPVTWLLNADGTVSGIADIASACKAGQASMPCPTDHITRVAINTADAIVGVYIVITCALLLRKLRFLRTLPYSCAKRGIVYFTIQVLLNLPTFLSLCCLLTWCCLFMRCRLVPLLSSSPSVLIAPRFWRHLCLPCVKFLQHCYTHVFSAATLYPKQAHHQPDTQNQKCLQQVYCCVC